MTKHCPFHYFVCTLAIAVNLSTDCPQLEADEPFVIVLGTAQDAGYPQAGCKKECCKPVWANPSLEEYPVCLAIVDPDSNSRWMIECTPAFPKQLRKLDEIFPVDGSPGLNGVLLTHAHIGHYAGLVHLGHEVMGAKDVPTYVMPRMQQFLTDNGPWSQLVTFKNILLMDLTNGTTVKFNERIAVTPITVPHRDEFSETVAFKIAGPNRSVLFLPDIDKWSRWETKIESVIGEVDVAFLDASFYDAGELPGRNMAEIPHPFIVESVRRFATLPGSERSKVRFIHLNHTNPARDDRSRAASMIRDAGMKVAKQFERIEL